MCAKAGAAPEGGPFHPHLTLARLRRPGEVTRWLRVLGGYAGPGWTSDEVTLIESHLGEGPRRRPRYEVLGRFPLGHAAPPGRTRTCDLGIRRPLLYPAELRRRAGRQPVGADSLRGQAPSVCAFHAVAA